MSLTTTYMITLTNNAVIMYDHCPHHRVGLGILLTVPGQLDASLHEFLVVSHHICCKDNDFPSNQQIISTFIRNFVAKPQMEIRPIAYFRSPM